MILVDTSAWIEYLRGTGSDAHQAVHRRIETDEVLATTDVVVMEVLAGARSQRHADQLEHLLARCAHLPVEHSHHVTAASLYRSCRSAGKTVRALTDCLIAAVALSADAEVLHADRDFDALATVSGLTARRQ